MFTTNKITAMCSAAALVLLASCASGRIPAAYYREHEKALQVIEESYKKLYSEGPFTISFTSRSFNTISLEIITDTLSYIYEFGTSEARLADTLTAYRLNAAGTALLIGQMQAIRCVWIKYFQYYTGSSINSLVFMSIKRPGVIHPFSNKRYYILSYFPRPQYFSPDGSLLDKKGARRIRKINGRVFHRINDKVCYSISGRYR